MVLWTSNRILYMGTTAYIYFPAKRGLQRSVAVATPRFLRSTSRERLIKNPCVHFQSPFCWPHPQNRMSNATSNKPQPVLRSSHRLSTLMPAIIDDLIQDHCNVQFNLAPGSPCTAPHVDSISTATAVLSQSGMISALSRYDQVRGSDALRKRWANYLYNPTHISGYADKDKPTEQPLQTLLPQHELMVTAGANQAFVNVILTLCDLHDNVLLPVPYYFSHKNALALATVHATLIQPDPNTLLPTVAAVASAITPRTRALVITNPSNPTGVVYPRALLDAFSELCVTKSIYLILDEAYLEYNFSDHNPHTTSSRAYSPPLQPHIIKINTMSKAFGLAGWRVGCVTYPRTLSTQMCKVQDTIPTHASSFSQIVALSALQLPIPHVTEAARIRHIFIETLTSLFKENLLRLKFVIPTGAFYVFVPYTADPSQSAVQDDDKVVHTLAKSFGVLTVPGHAFGLAGYIRVCYGAVHFEEAQHAAMALANGLQVILRGK